MLHDIAYSLLYRQPAALAGSDAAGRAAARLRLAGREGPWTGFAAAFEQRWLDLFAAPAAARPLPGGPCEPRGAGPSTRRRGQPAGAAKHPAPATGQAAEKLIG